ncbi:hypothetical protein FRB94_005138 [Tulasnella sp. JGI-2019a]|nr:hypothetical protein FRB94_005138 [Tulasnella sp. JGI-2019a]KAG9017738.1 hypothetical protein FRB93_004549 [Tulasnella sp. JGI-2019a]KAG9035808.1 hypothetical protein FRB95_010402 [Tulasnella sp. JGI-2019a]
MNNMNSFQGDVSLARGVMVGVWTESVFWGLHTGFVILCGWVFKYRRRHLRGGVLAVTLLMYALATIHCFAELSRLINGFINHNADPAVLTTYNTLNDVGRMLIYVLNNSLSDAVVVWRCLVVWQRNRLACAIPILLLLAMTINGIFVVCLFATGHAGDPAFIVRITQQQIAFFALSLATNSITTAFVAGRIWYLAHKDSVPGLDASRYNHVVAMLVESGLLYSSLKICELVLFVMGSHAFYIVFDSIVQIMCIAPTGIFIWVALGATEGSKYNDHVEGGGLSGNIGAMTGASFRFARPNTTMRRNHTLSITGNSFTMYASRHGSVVDFSEVYKSKRDVAVGFGDIERDVEMCSPGSGDSGLSTRSTTLEGTIEIKDDESDDDRIVTLRGMGRTVTLETTASTLKTAEKFDGQDVDSEAPSPTTTPSTSPSAKHVLDTPPSTHQQDIPPIS